MVVLTKAGLRIFLRSVIAAWPLKTLWLYTNPVTLTEETVLDDLQLATFPGFIAQALNTWSIPYQVPSAEAVQTDAGVYTFTQTYAPSAPETVYGYAVLSPVPHLIWAEAAPEPIPMLGSPQSIQIAPNLQLGNQT